MVPYGEDYSLSSAAVEFVPRLGSQLQRGCATRSSETDAIRQRGMEGKGQVIEDSHGPSITKNLDNCASIQVR